MEGPRPRFLIEQPELRVARGLLLRQVMTYNVRVEGGDFAERGHHHSVLTKGARKRYTEFRALRRVLLARYGGEGLLVPPLPPKHSGTQDADFVKRRMSGLALFLEGLAASPFFAVDASVERFLTTTSEGNGTIGGGGGASMDLDEEALGALDGSAGGSSGRNSDGGGGSNRGYQVWQEHLAGLPNPPQADVQLAQVRNELEVAERGLREALGASKGLGNGLAHLASALQGFSQALHVAADGEQSIAALNDTEDDGAGEGPSVPELVTKTAALYSTVSPGFAAARDQLAHLFAEILEYELAAVHALKGLLQGRGEQAAALLKLQRKLHALQHRNDPGRANELALLQAQVGQEEMRCYKYTKALLGVSIPGAARARARNLRRAFAHLAAVTTAASAVQFHASLAYLSQLSLTPEEVVGGANDAAAALVLPPVPSIALPARPRPSAAATAKPAASSSAASASASTAALAAAKVAKPGSFLAEPAPIPSSSSSTTAEKSNTTNGAASAPSSFSSVVLTLPSATPRLLPSEAPSSVGEGTGKGKVKAPWESDDEADDPFTPVTAEGNTNKKKGNGSEV